MTRSICLHCFPVLGPVPLRHLPWDRKLQGGCRSHLEVCHGALLHKVHDQAQGGGSAGGQRAPVDPANPHHEGALPPTHQLSLPQQGGARPGGGDGEREERGVGELGRRDREREREGGRERGKEGEGDYVCERWIVLSIGTMLVVPS